MTWAATSSTQDGRGRPTSVGEPLARAARFGHGSDTSGAGAVAELRTPGARMGTVVWQTPLPGARQDRGAVEASLTIAVPDAPTCTGAQLRAVGIGAGRAAGGDRYGVIDLWNRSARPCALSHVRVQGRAGGRAVTMQMQFSARWRIIPTRGVAISARNRGVDGDTPFATCSGRVGGNGLGLILLGTF